MDALKGWTNTRPSIQTRQIARRKSKYGNEKTTVFGITFDSKKEAQRYIILKTSEKCGVIRGLKLQHKFTLIPRQEDKTGRVVERPVVYVADFTYYDRNGEFVVEDTKGVKTPEYIIKRKLMLYHYGIKIHEV